MRKVEPGVERTRYRDRLTVRVIGLSTIWATAAVLVVGGLISNLYERTAFSGFESVVRAQLFSLINTVTVDEAGGLSGSPNLGDLSYAQPLSGWYWEVIPLGEETRGRLASFSLGPGRIEAPGDTAVPFDLQYRRDYRADGLDGETLYVEEAEVVLDAQNRAARFRVMGNQSIVDADIRNFNGRLTSYLGLFGAGSILINALAILYGLRPLTRVRVALGEVRTGRTERLTGYFPAEIRPLADEMNALIDNNRRIVERARTQVGNLAHSLKTPLAVLTNEAEIIGGDKGRLVADETERMRQQVQHYLDRARVAALAEGAIMRVPVRSSLERVVRVMRRLQPDLDIALDAPKDELLLFAGEREDFEEIVGNLVENAGKWARRRVRVSAAALSDSRFRLSIDDDGPGLTASEMAEATKRGRRLDEGKPGSGLGLSIVTDTVLQYRGEFVLEPSQLGGLRAVLVLPRASRETI